MVQDLQLVVHVSARGTHYFHKCRSVRVLIYPTLHLAYAEVMSTEGLIIALLDGRNKKPPTVPSNVSIARMYSTSFSTRYFPILLIPFAIVALTGPSTIGQDRDFAHDIRPTLSDTCYACHGPDSQARVTDLRLDQRDSVMQSGILESGELLKRLTSTDEDYRMPPPDASRPISSEDRERLTRWIKDGGRWPEDDRHWAFIPPSRPVVPNVEHTEWIHNEIDAFVVKQLEARRIQASQLADKETLLRRVTFDLTGLPPSVSELNAFLADESPTAYESVIDRLLSSERYGEHMALDWLEASRYADTDGYQNDRLRYMWVWRDWLIMALNNNMPFDQFIVEQMAGDLLEDRDFFTQVATGFNRNHRINSEGGAIPDEWIVEYVADRVETMGTVFLGLTLNCCRCHDHKYDPISQRDFYQLFAFFNNIAEAGLGPNNGNSPPFIPVPKSWPNLTADEAVFVKPEPAKVNLQQVSVPRPQPGSPETVMVLHELAKPRPTYRLIRGQYDQPDTTESLGPRTPSLLGNWDAKWPNNRLGLARWLTTKDHPLTSRVTMNRTWQHFFGTGLVKTSENFGIQGERPSHPELLDWLALEFVEEDWNVKAMHKRIVMSRTYQQSSMTNDHQREQDPENRLLARGPRRRLSPFAIRDTALFVSGLLQEDIGGPSVKPYMPPGIWRSISNATYKQDHGEKLYRRSMYTYWRRTVPPPTMMAFNAAARESCAVRNELTTTPLQALTLLNNVTFVEAARLLAERLLKARELTTDRDRIQWAFRAITSRQPSDDEIKILQDDLARFRIDFKNRPATAKQLLKVGEKPHDPELDLSATAAFTLVANTIFNLDESMSQN